ncbi:MAG: multidrug ABC transporter ATP-binding protein, partial [Pseudoruegeria sp.]
MLRLFENFVDPYTPYEETDHPPQRLWPFMREYARPFTKLFVLTGLMSLVIASIELWLIYYMGRVVDILSTGTPDSVRADYGF